MNIKNIYNQLTNVNIDEQKQLWNERGKGYYGEFLLFNELYTIVPGFCKILMNLSIPTSNGKTTEIDLLMIHETGIYVFEVKYYKGTIYGNSNDRTWTQYFRTTSNSVFKNPMMQNNYHIAAVKNMFPDIPVNSIIVFTNRECDLKIMNNTDISVCKINNLHNVLNHKFKYSENKYSIEDIDLIFDKLSKYSQMNEPIIMDGIEKSFISWLEPEILMLNNKQKELEQEKRKTIFSRYITIIISIIIIIIFAILSFSYINSIKINYTNKLNKINENYNNELSKFKQNFLHVDEIGNEYIDMANDFVDVSNLSLVDLSDNAVSFSARLSMNNDIYGIQLNENSKYIIMTNDKIYEYDVFGDHLKYNSYANKIGSGIKSYGDLANAQFFGIKKNDITYIKITNISLFKIDFSRTIIKDELELELYQK